MNGRTIDEDAQVGAWIARGRVREMQARGWRILGPIRDDAVWMSGPDPEAVLENVREDDAESGPWAQVAAALPTAAAAAVGRLRRGHGAALALHRPHGRRVA